MSESGLLTLMRAFRRTALGRLLLALLGLAVAAIVIAAVALRLVSVGTVASAISGTSNATLIAVTARRWRQQQP